MPQVDETRFDDPLRYPLAGGTVDGLVVRSHIPNQSSIQASLEEYDVLRGVRELPFAWFTTDAPTKRTIELAADILANGEINPLIVVDEGAGPYILEGAHRFDALQILGKTTFPALVVINMDDPPAPQLEPLQKKPGAKP